MGDLEKALRQHARRIFNEGNDGSPEWIRYHRLVATNLTDAANAIYLFEKDGE